MKPPVRQIDDPFEEAVLGGCVGDTTTPGSEQPLRRFDRAVYALIVLLGALAGLGPLAIDMYLPAFPAIAKDLGSSVSEVERTLAAYFVGLALGQLFYGPIADRFGRKLPLYTGLTTFIVASIGCALARSVEGLVVMRFLQALGGCAEMVVARAVIRDRFEQRDAARVFSSLVLVMGVAPILAPLVGGWLVLAVGWRSVFYVLAGFAALCLVAVAFFLRESLPPERRQRHGVASTLGIYARLLRDRQFMAYTLAGSLVSAGMFAYIGGSPFVFIELFGVREDRFGWFFGSNAAGLILASQVNGALVRRYEPARILTVALAVAAAAGATLLAVATTGAGGFVGFLAPLFVFVASLGFIFPNTTALAMAPHGTIAGNASALFGSIQFLISGVGGLIVSMLHTGTAIPLAVTMAVCAAAAFLINCALTTRDLVPATAEGAHA